MELKLEVVLSSSIKRKKPWPRFCWLGQERESVFLLDDKRISEINMVSGRTKRRIPKLHPLLHNVVTMGSPSNGIWLCGLLTSGEMFLWNRDKDLLKTTTTDPEVVNFTSTVQGNATKLSLQVSGDGMRVVLVAVTGEVFLWQCIDARDLIGVRDCTVKGNWTQIQPSNDSMLPTSQDKEACVHTIFVKTEALGDICLSTFVFTSGKKLIISCFKINWGENQEKVGPVNYSVRWTTKIFQMSSLKPPCQPVKSRGALVPAFSPDGQLLAIVLNQRQPQASQVLFVSTVNFVSVSRSLGGCGSKKMDIPSKYTRSYWVGSVSWSAGSLFLACVLKRGSLLMFARLGGLLTLSSSGCNVDFGPAHFLPLHPLVTYRLPATAGKGETSLSSSSLSVQDVMRQRYSVTWHPQLFYFIVSDGYMATVVRVQDKISPTLLMKTLLRDTTEDLEKASQLVENSQKHIRVWLHSVSDLNPERSLQELSPTFKPNTIISANRSALPYFLQDHSTIGNNRELIETVQNLFDDDSDLEGIPVGSHVEDSGRLEFASMFDTLHALDTHYKPLIDTDSEGSESTILEKKITYELEKIQCNLLTAWAFGMSLGSFDENRSLLKHAVKCAVRFAALLQSMPNSMHSENAAIGIFDFLKKLLYFIPLDNGNSDGPQSIGLVIELCRRLVQLALTPYTESYHRGYSQISSHNFFTALQILQMVSESLDHTYTLQQKAVWSSSEKEDPSQLWPLDIHCVPLLQDVKNKDKNFAHGTWPSRRLHRVWRWVYTIARDYVEELPNFKSCDNWEEEKKHLVVIMSKIQTMLQATGERLEEGHGLLNYTGELLFLSGFYSKSDVFWHSQLWEENKKGGERSIFQEKRLCLALLYSLLSQYRLKEAQELGDHMSHLILLTDKHQKDSSIVNKAEPVKYSWLPSGLNDDTAYAVVQTLGRFMASYFSNQTLYILPPHSVAVLPPIHLPHASSVGRLVPLCQQEVAKAVRQQQLSEIWTVEYAQDLLLLGGLLPECVWLAYNLGDWKAAVSLSLAYTWHCCQHFDFTCFRKRELYLPKDLEPASILQAVLKCLLNSSNDSKVHNEIDGNKSVTEEEDRGLLQISIQDILKASVMAGVDVVSAPLSSLVDKAKDLCSCLTAMVPTELYLPSPPLYCPQPAPNSQDPAGTLGYLTEVASRNKVSEVLQNVLLLLSSAHCCHPAAQWYLNQLRRVKHILYKMKKKYSYPSAPEEEKAFPEGLLKFINKGGYFRQGPKKDRHMDPATIQTIICFRELCGICWMLHVRDQLSISCRKYQAHRLQARNNQISADSEVRSTCVDALQWARRFLPFSRFLNSEEILQDTLLSLLSELPPVLLVADTLVEAFPGEEESIRVPLREKYNSLMQSIRLSNVIGAGKETGEMMMVLIQDKRRLRKKHFGRLRRHLAPLELHLWEKEMEEDDGGSKHGMAMLRQLSLGTSLSTSTLTDCGLLPLCSDGDTTENTSEAPLSPDIQNRSMPRTKKSKIPDRGDRMKTALKIQDVIKEEGPCGDAKLRDKTNKGQPFLPLVGSWEFELEDEEYLNFLELFLSYVLEKDSADGSNTSCELPLLKDFSNKLREKELHSLTFDVLTTMHRRQRDGHHQARQNYEYPVFRAGCCFRSFTQDSTQKLSVVSKEISMSQNQIMVDDFSQLTKGLFGHRKHQLELSQRSIKSNHLDSKTSPIRSAFPTQESPECLRLCSVAPFASVMELKQGLDTKLEAQFPELSRLLEWMMRWADKRLLLRQHGKKNDKGDEAGETADEGVVIRVKASAPAILTSLSLLEHRYTALLGTDRYVSHIQIPETEWAVAPVLELTTNRKMERESSVDTGYPASANTPINVLDSSVGQEALSVASCAGEPEELGFYRMHLEDQNGRHTHNPIIAPSSEPYENVKVTTEIQADKHSHSDDSEDSFSITTETPGTSLKLADLEKFENVSSSASMLLKPSSHTQPTLSTKISENVVQKNVGSKVPVSSSPADLPGSHPAPFGEPPSVSLIPDETHGIQPPHMRQRLGEDLFRLVQNINYMSLMEVLGASFSNLQLAHQNSSLTQSNLISNPNRPLLNVNNSGPGPNALSAQSSVVPPFQSSNTEPEIAQFTHAPVYVHSNQDSKGNQPHVNTNLQTTHAFANNQILSSVRMSGQEMHPLSVEAESPVTFIEARNLIPCSEGLLTTTEFKPIDNKGILPSNNSIENDPSPIISKLKLLQLRPPLAPHYTPSQGLQTPQNNPCHDSSPSRFKQNDHTVYARNQGNLNSSEPKPVPGSSVLLHHISERFRGQDISLLPQSYPVYITPTPQGLKLLQVQPVSGNNITLPELQQPTKLFSRPSTALSVPMGVTPRIKLLQVESQPKIMLPLQASLQMARLIPDGELRSTMGKIQNDTLQMLRAEKPEDHSKKSVVFQNSYKRQKRRDKLGKALTTEVTFRPHESIILPEPTDSPTEAAQCPEEVTLTQDITIPPGPLLRGEKLVEKAIATAAELHAFASTCKRPPECFDAFTNTDPDCCPVLLDKAVSAEVPNTVSSLKSLRQEQMNGNVTELREVNNLIQDGHQFISVVDLEDQSLHNDLPPCHNNQSSIFAEPTTAQLHVMATKVLRNVADSQALHECTKVICKKSDLLSHSLPEKNVEDAVVDLCESGAEICGAIKTQTLVSHSVSPQPTVWFSSQMSQLDTQLAALQHIADSLETDFCKSRMLVSTIENLSPGQATEVKTTTPVKKTVRLHVPHERWTTHVTEPNACNQEQQSILDFHAFEEKSSINSNKMSSQKTGRSDIHSPPRTKCDLTELSELSDILADETLEQTGLSDTVELLEQLVREGFLSPTDLDLVTSTTYQSRHSQEKKERMSQKRILPEDERKAVRIWMRKKQRERLAVYQKQRQSLRDMEHRPFSTSAKAKPVNKNTSLKSNEKQNRVLAHFNQRTLEAYNLASDISGSPPVIQGFSDTEGASASLTVRPSTAPPSKNTYRVYSSSVRDKSPTGQANLNFFQKTDVRNELPLNDYHTRLGLDRPVTSLPRDRLSQVTRRGMVTDTSHLKMKTGSPSRASVVERGYPSKKIKNLGRASETYRVFEKEESHLDITGLDNKQEEEENAIADGTQWDWLDNLSETGSSNLSKIDWAAIERIVAEET